MASAMTPFVSICVPLFARCVEANGNIISFLHNGPKAARTGSKHFLYAEFLINHLNHLNHPTIPKMPRTPKIPNGSCVFNKQPN